MSCKLVSAEKVHEPIELKHNVPCLVGRSKTTQIKDTLVSRKQGRFSKPLSFYWETDISVWGKKCVLRESQHRKKNTRSKIERFAFITQRIL